jgi:hypothetical protein
MVLDVVAMVVVTTTKHQGSQALATVPQSQGPWRHDCAHRGWNQPSLSEEHFTLVPRVSTSISHFPQAIHSVHERREHRLLCHK